MQLARISMQEQIDIGKDRKALRNLQILCCDVVGQMAFIALNNSEITVHSIFENKQILSFNAWQSEEVIFLKAMLTRLNTYLIVVYRTASLLYQVKGDRVERVCAYFLNSKKCPAHKHDVNNKYSNNSRFYFTSARIELLHDSETIEKVGKFNQKLNRLALAQKVSEGSILLKFMRDFLENQANRESSLVDDFQDLEQFFTHVENDTINDSLENEVDLNHQHTLTAGNVGGGVGANGGNVVNTNQEQPQEQLPSHTDMSISKIDQGVKAVVANLNNQNIGESSHEDE